MGRPSTPFRHLGSPAIPFIAGPVHGRNGRTRPSVLYPANGRKVQAVFSVRGQNMGDFDKGQDMGGKPGQDDGGKPGFDKQQEQQGGKPDQGQDQGGDFGGKPDFDKQQEQQGGKPGQGQDQGGDWDDKSGQQQ